LIPYFDHKMTLTFDLDLERWHPWLDCHRWNTIQEMLYRSKSCWLIDWLIDWLIIYGFRSRLWIFHLYGDVTIAGEGLQNLGLCSAHKGFEQCGIFIVPHLLWHRTSVFQVSSEGPPHSVASCDTREDVEELF
jgi:hypothetical protein